MKRIFTIARLGALLGLLPAGFLGGQGPEVRLWMPYSFDSPAGACLLRDLENWAGKARQNSENQLPLHRFVSLPEGRYVDQLTAAFNTGEQPDLALMDARQLAELNVQGAGSLYAVNLVGLWVNEGQLAGESSAFRDLIAVWTGEPQASLAAFEAVLRSLSGPGVPALGLDTGRDDQALGDSLLALFYQLTPALRGPSAPDWSSTAVSDLLQALARWQDQELMREVQLAQVQMDATQVPPLVLARFSAGQALGLDFAFYPLFSNQVGQPASYIEYPYVWMLLRPEGAGLWQALHAAIEAGEVFETCGVAAGLLSRLQLTSGVVQQVELVEIDTVGSEDLLTSAPVEDRPALQASIVQSLGSRAGRIAPINGTAAVPWQPQWAPLPMALSHAVRDMRAGLSVENAVRALTAEQR